MRDIGPSRNIDACRVSDPYANYYLGDRTDNGCLALSPASCAKAVSPTPGSACAFTFCEWKAQNENSPFASRDDQDEYTKVVRRTALR
jgi:hypothetical protein